MKTIDKYTVTGLLGKGGMGCVYKVRYPVTGKIGALKYLDPDSLLMDIMGRETVETLFTREAVTMAGVRHPHVLEIFDFGRWEGDLYYTMDYYGNNLGQLMGEGMETEKPSRILGLERTFDLAFQILEGLGCLHWSGIIHRDIKPFNILLTELGTVKIGDFGLSRLHGESLPVHSSVKVGSPYYAAPEQEKDPELADERSDLFSVGVMLYRMVTGRLPETDSGLEFMKGLDRLNPDLDATWIPFLQTAMAPEPDQRFQTAQDMAAALTELRQHWQDQKKQACALPPDLDLNMDTVETETAGSRNRGDVRVSPRSTPVKQRSKDARHVFGLSTLMIPEPFFSHKFEVISQGRILDHNTGLEWEQSGSPYPMTWTRAAGHIAALNQKTTADPVETGHSPWRLPTIEELITILSPLPQGGDHCLDPVFDTRQTFLWSCDRCSFISAWYVNLEMGFVGKNDFESQYHVKAVRNVMQS